ncbi:hypothetical protein SO694_00016153 [Aureococcus anophagefferens]|uniref:UDENN domain-containing protein n=1 Tax=Aureococcus anophagefferens TaxID=44056 RepID=A0ABR1G1U4_AURAN
MASRSGSVAEAALADPPKRDITIPIGAVVTKAEAAPPQRQRVTYVTAAFAEADAARKAAFGPELLQLWPETCSPPLPAGAAGRARFAFSSPRPRAVAPAELDEASRRVATTVSPGAAFIANGRRFIPGELVDDPSYLLPWEAPAQPPSPEPVRRVRRARAPRRLGHRVPRAAAAAPRGAAAGRLGPGARARATARARAAAAPPEPAAEQLPPAVGSRVRVHTFPENDDRRPPAWFPATVARVARAPPAGGPRRAPRRSALMEAFLLGGCARGDKWMPWHCALGAHERYLLEVVYALPRLESDRDRYILGYAFSGSREIELFERILRPLFEADASDDDAALGRSLLDDPHAALRRDGELHRRYAAYRAEDKKLHTTAYLCHPARGSSGDEFVCYIIDRTARFVVLGARIYALLRAKLGDGFEAWAATHRPRAPRARAPPAPPPAPPPSLGGPDLKLSLEQALLQEDEIGPTMTKMFLVSTHLAYPAAKILDGSCAVGDGAGRVRLPLPGRPAAVPLRAPRRAPVHPQRRPRHAGQGRRPRARLLPMLRFVAAAARARFGSMFAPVVSESITPYDLQVNLCEWRKFRTKVDRKRARRRGAVLDRAPRARAARRRAQAAQVAERRPRERRRPGVLLRRLARRRVGRGAAHDARAS